MQPLECLTSDPELLLRAKAALKVVHGWNNDPTFPYNPAPFEIQDRVACLLDPKADQNNGNYSLNALNREREKFKSLEVIQFLTKNGFLVAISPIAYRTAYRTGKLPADFYK